VKTCTFMGTLSSGESVFRSKDGGLGVEKDHRYLVDATPAETAEIYEKWPHIIPANKEGILPTRILESIKKPACIRRS
jgi:hypothetical protein